MSFDQDTGGTSRPFADASLSQHAQSATSDRSRVPGHRRRLGLAAAAVVLSTLITADVGQADQANWQVGCVQGYTCMWYGNIFSSAALAAENRDSNFSNDYYSGGTVLNDRVKYVHNRFLGATRVRGFSAASYGGVAYTCLSGGGHYSGPHPFTFSGVSSYRSC